MKDFEFEITDRLYWLIIISVLVIHDVLISNFAFHYSINMIYVQELNAFNIKDIDSIKFGIIITLKSLFLYTLALLVPDKDETKIPDKIK